MLPPPARSTLFPYTTLFRSGELRGPGAPHRPALPEHRRPGRGDPHRAAVDALVADRKSTRLNSSHVRISYAVFCLKKKIYLSTITVPLLHSSLLCVLSLFFL